ncbi:MAG TPA: DUF4173 domain-containing protein [Anaerolineae bacterium]
MQQTNRLAWTVIAIAIVSGILGDLLLHGSPWGVNVPLYAVAVAGSVFLAARASGQHLTGGGRWLAIPAVLCAMAYIWRDSTLLLAGDLLVTLLLLALLFDRARTGQLRVAGIMDYALGIFMAGIHAAFGVLVLLFGDIQWQALRLSAPSGRVTSNATRVGLGVLLACPLLLIFGALFAAADATFAQMIHDLFNWNLNELPLHLLLSAFFFWITAGALRMALFSTPMHFERLDQSGGRLGIIETATVLGLLDALFLAFVVLQFRYLFGGASTLGYAEYARRGFFELVLAAALVLLVLLGAHWLLRKDAPSHVWVFNGLAGLLIALEFVTMASALQRMALYVSEYGLTELRLYTTAFMGWLALVFVWFVFTYLRDKSDRFAFGILAAGLLITLGLNILNPDAFIARTNVARITVTTASGERPLDAPYLASLSADALPVLLDALPNVPDPQRCQAATLILQRWSAPSTDWRMWNWSRAQAGQLVLARHDYLQEIACPLGTTGD